LSTLGVIVSLGNLELLSLRFLLLGG
jgi:hypothetical protein